MRSVLTVFIILQCSVSAWAGIKASPSKDSKTPWLHHGFLGDLSNPHSFTFDNTHVVYRLKRSVLQANSRRLLKRKDMQEVALMFSANDIIGAERSASVSNGQVR